jgi:uncharacterized membrane protein
MSELSAENAPAVSVSAARRALPWLVVLVLAVSLVSWLLNTPAGLLGKADAIGYAICHRIDLRSFHLGERQLPLCARCTGMYLGVLVGFGGMAALGRRRAGRLPPRPVLAVLFGFMGLMAVDGVNSYLSFFPPLPHLYAPHNTLRLITGTFNGLALAGLMYPVLNQSLWFDWEDRPALANLRELLLLVIGAAIVIALVLTESPVALYPLALLSTLGVVVILVALNTTLLLAVVRRENLALGWRGALLPLTAGLALAIIEIALVDAGRYAVFHTWGGLPLPG